MDDLCKYLHIYFTLHSFSYNDLVIFLISTEEDGGLFVVKEIKFILLIQ